MGVRVCFLVAGEIIGMENPSKNFASLGWFFATVNIALVIHGFIILPLIYGLLTKKNPFTFIKNQLPAMFTAFGTSSSSASLPVNLKCLVKGNGVDKRIADFVLPIGATINMDGSALYEAVAALFVAQISGIDL